MLEIDEDGRILKSIVLIVYNELDEDGNIFLPGCFDNWIEKLKQGTNECKRG